LTVRIDHDDAAFEQAFAWQQALGHDEADWDGYLAWLEADPVHRRVFDEVALLDRTIDDHASELRTAFAEPEVSLADDWAGAEPARPRRWWVIAGAVAAVFALVLAIPRFLVRDDVVYITSAGETRRVALGAGEAVDLAPSSRLIARGGDVRRLELADGEAYFSIKHDPSRTLSIKADGLTVSDIGTRFGVSFTQDQVTVAVADGQVTVAAASGQSRQVAAGQRLVGRAGKLMPLSSVAAEDVGSWRSGRLVYDRAPLRIVVADLARFSGKRVSVEPVIGDRTFSGVLGISDGSRPFQNLADLMAISYKTDAGGVRFVAGTAR
jgi:transmembrane sensor